jgi:hypothetical protein
VIHILLWIMMAIQMGAWLWLQICGGKLGDKSYLVWCCLMMVGQAGCGIECATNSAWGTLLSQIYFFSFTGIGGIVRLRQMRKGVYACSG